MLMMNMSAPIARCRCSISGHLSTRLLGLSKYRRMAPNSGWLTRWFRADAIKPQLCRLKNSYGGSRKLFQELKTQFLSSICRLQLLLDFTHLALPLLIPLSTVLIQHICISSPRGQPSFASDQFNFWSLSSTFVPPLA